MMKRIFFLCCFLMCLKAFDAEIITSVRAAPSSDIQQCINTRSRIERLSCFDRVFNVEFHQEGLTSPENFLPPGLRQWKALKRKVEI